MADTVLAFVMWGGLGVGGGYSVLGPDGSLVRRLAQLAFVVGVNALAWRLMENGNLP